MRQFAIDAPAQPDPAHLARHSRLFELIRQQNRAQRVAERMSQGALPEAEVLAQIARRAAASWEKLH